MRVTTTRSAPRSLRAHARCVGPSQCSRRSSATSINPLLNSAGMDLKAAKRRRTMTRPASQRMKRSVVRFGQRLAQGESIDLGVEADVEAKRKTGKRDEKVLSTGAEEKSCKRLRYA